MEGQKRQEYQTSSSNGTVVVEVIKRWLHTLGDIAQLDACVAVAAASVNVCFVCFALLAPGALQQLVCLLPWGASG